jgi:transcriptional regulator with XRE-family HTH domain
VLAKPTYVLDNPTMAIVSRKKRNWRGAKPDLELASKVKELRTSLAISQSALAELIDVSRSQVVEWETGGNERPSVEKLLALAKIAPDAQIRRWLFLRAGVDLEVIRRDFHEEVSLRITTAPDLETGVDISNAFFDIPIWDAEHIESEGPIPSRAGPGKITLPLRILPHPTSTLGLICSTIPPWSMSSGDLVIVDRTVTDPSVLLGRMTAIVASGLHSNASSTDSHTGSSRCERAGLIVGRLCLQSEFDEDPDHESNSRQTRMILRLGMQVSKKRYLALSTWVTSSDPLKYCHEINSDYRICGEVIAWISLPGLKRTGVALRGRGTDELFR